jgi:transglutaminase-like putative cysteine protease
VCRDFAHAGISFCRALGIPPRYVFGYLPDIGIPGPVSDDGPRYVTVAVGRDSGDVPPTSGTFEAYPGELTTHKRAAVVRVEYVQPTRRRFPAGGSPPGSERSVGEERP